MHLPPEDHHLVAILRGLLIAEIVISALGLPFVLLSEIYTARILEERGWVTDSTNAELVQSAFACVVLAAAVPAMIVSWIGLFNFWGWSRWLYLGVNCAMALLGILLGIFQFSFEWGLPNAVIDLGQPIWGCIAGIIFLSPVARCFQGKPLKDTPVDARG